MQRAAQVLKRSKQQVTSLFNEARLGKAVDPQQCLPLVEQISASLARNGSALLSLARLKTSDEYTYMHSVAVCALMIAMARQLGLSEEHVREAGEAGLLHDIGKMAIPDAILNKPGKLTDAEFGTMRSHPEAGARMLLDCRQVSALVIDVCLHHHEKFDGSGYPHRLTGEQISLFARMGAVCDVYDAITSDRPYKKGWDPAEALAGLRRTYADRGVVLERIGDGHAFRKRVLYLDEDWLPPPSIAAAVDAPTLLRPDLAVIARATARNCSLDIPHTDATASGV